LRKVTPSLASLKRAGVFFSVTKSGRIPSHTITTTCRALPLGEAGASAGTNAPVKKYAHAVRIRANSLFMGLFKTGSAPVCEVLIVTILQVDRFIPWRDASPVRVKRAHLKLPPSLFTQFYCFRLIANDWGARASGSREGLILAGSVFSLNTLKNYAHWTESNQRIFLF